VARRTFGVAMSTDAANSFAPIARITLPTATWMDTPSSMAASRNSRTNVLSRRSSERPSSQFLLGLAAITSASAMSRARATLPWAVRRRSVRRPATPPR
jgi:hypothetical protein